MPPHSRSRCSAVIASHPLLSTPVGFTFVSSTPSSSSSLNTRSISSRFRRCRTTCSTPNRMSTTASTTIAPKLYAACDPLGQLEISAHSYGAHVASGQKCPSGHGSAAIPVGQYIPAGHTHGSYVPCGAHSSLFSRCSRHSSVGGHTRGHVDTFSYTLFGHRKPRGHIPYPGMYSTGSRYPSLVLSLRHAPLTALVSRSNEPRRAMVRIFFFLT
mmetsp:Transcript_67769/g.78728  ORF Transcript_67769/g.78728 Transcript_67769/m.78728 type:complete len:214 (+) Transcript_67769:2222-2863(+)